MHIYICVAQWLPRKMFLGGGGWGEWRCGVPQIYSKENQLSKTFSPLEPKPTQSYSVILGIFFIFFGKRSLPRQRMARRPASAQGRSLTTSNESRKENVNLPLDQ